MAKRASPAKPGATARKRAAKPKSKAATARKPARKSAKRALTPRSPGRRSSDLTAADALYKLLESPLVAELLAIGATAALGAIAESRFGRKGDAGRKSGNSVKAAGKAAAAAIGRRLSSEVEEIRKASKKAKGSARA